MKINLLFIGLDCDNSQSILQRTEFLTASLPADSEFSVYQAESDSAIDAIACWASTKNLGEFEDADFTVFAGTAEAAEAAKRFAASKGLTCYTEILELKEEADEIKAVRKVYSTHLDAYLPVKGSVLSMAQAGDKKEYNITEAADVVIHPAKKLVGDETTAVKANLIKSTKLEKTEDLANAKLVLLGGKGLGNKENFQRLERLAEKLGAACGCTRPVAMAGWTTYDKVVGLSGSILQADVCIAFGVSGAGPLMQGAKGAARLIAVNNDPKAPIFYGASDGIVADCIEIIAAMEEEV